MSGLENEIQAKFAHLSDERLMNRMNRAEDFGYDDEEVELTRRLKLGGLAWRWADINGREQVEVYKPSPSDEELVNRAITEAREADTEIPDTAARVIASQLHGGQFTALYSLASTGFIDEDRLPGELVAIYNDPETEPQVKEWVNWIGTYALNRADKGAVEGWSKLWLGGES